jgi:predicted metal-dependent hydrolase
MSKTPEKIFMDPEIGEVTLRKSVRSSRMSIKVHPLKGVSVTIPYIMPYAAGMIFFRSRRSWIIDTIARQKEKFKDVHLPSVEEVDALRKQARKELPPRL